MPSVNKWVEVYIHELSFRLFNSPYLPILGHDISEKVRFSAETLGKKNLLLGKWITPVATSMTIAGTPLREWHEYLRCNVVG